MLNIAGGGCLVYTASRTRRVKTDIPVKNCVPGRGGEYIRRWCSGTNWLCSVLRGHYAYFGLPSDFDRIHGFYQETSRLCYRALNRRSQRQLTRERCVRLLERFPRPVPPITHPRPAAAW